MTDPTITIAGLEARINSLRSAVQHSNRTAAERMTMFVEASSNADRLTAERDALAAQLAKARAALDAAPKVCAIHSYEHGPGPCLTCGAWPPGTRELIAACQARIAGLEQAANDRSRTGQMSEPERSEWIGAAVAVADALGGSLGPVSGTSGTIDPREWIHFAAGLADRAKKMVERHGEHLRAGADAVRSANASTAEIGARMEAAGEEIEALRAKLAEATSLLRSAGDLFVEIQATDGEDEHKAITDGAKLSAAIAAALEAL